MFNVQLCLKTVKKQICPNLCVKQKLKSAKEKKSTKSTIYAENESIFIYWISYCNLDFTLFSFVGQYLRSVINFIRCIDACKPIFKGRNRERNAFCCSSSSCKARKRDNSWIDKMPANQYDRSQTSIHNWWNLVDLIARVCNSLWSSIENRFYHYINRFQLDVFALPTNCVRFFFCL